MTIKTYGLTLYGMPVCPCLMEWVPAFEEELREQKIIETRLNWAQFIGEADASALTHSWGGVGDCWEIDPVISKVARQMGCVMHPRITGSFADNKHSHGGLIGCPHMHPQALAQITETYAGGDGLLGDVPDEVWLHQWLFPKRTWRQGIAWHKAQQKDRKRLAKIQRGRERRAKWRRWIKKSKTFTDRLEAQA